MKWTRQVPMESGYYWLIDDDIVCVGYYNYENVTVVHSDIFTDYLFPATDIEFWGPKIEQPETPEPCAKQFVKEFTPGDKANIGSILDFLNNSPYYTERLVSLEVTDQNNVDIYFSDESSASSWDGILEWQS